MWLVVLGLGRTRTVGGVWIGVEVINALHCISDLGGGLVVLPQSPSGSRRLQRLEIEAIPWPSVLALDHASGIRNRVFVLTRIELAVRARGCSGLWEQMTSSSLLTSALFGRR